MFSREGLEIMALILINKKHNDLIKENEKGGNKDE